MDPLLIERSLFFHNLAHDFRAAKTFETKPGAGVSQNWLKQSLEEKRATLDNVVTRPPSLASDVSSRRHPITNCNIAVVEPSSNASKRLDQNATKQADDSSLELAACYSGLEEDEDDSNEREFVCNSPPKGQKRINSNVGGSLLISPLFRIFLLVNGWHRARKMPQDIGDE